MCFLLIEPEGAPRNVSLVKERVKIVAMKKGYFSATWCFIGSPQ